MRIIAVLASGSTDLGGDWLTDWPPNDTDKAKLTLEATSRNGQDLFVGIGRTTDVEGFLADKPWGEITVFSDDPSDTLVLMNADGSAAVDADTSFELHVPRLNVVLLVGIVIGAIVLLIGLALMVKGGRDRNEAMPPMP